MIPMAAMQTKPRPDAPATNWFPCLVALRRRARSAWRKTMPVVAIMLALAAVAAPAAARDHHDFGEVFQGEAVAHDFVLSNTGAQPLRIASVSLAPPLRLARMPAVIAPGTSATLSLGLDTARVEGGYTGELVVVFADPAAAPRTFTLAGKVRPLLEVLPRPAFFLSTTQGEDQRASLDIVNHDDAPLRLSLDAVESPHYRLALHTVEDGRHYRLEAAVPADAPLGRNSDFVELARADAEPLRIGIHTRVHGRVHTFPDSVDFGRLRADELANATVATQTLMVYQEGGRDFSVVASSDVPGLVLRTERSADGDRVMVTAAFDDAPRGRVAGTIELRTSDPQFPLLKVPVAADIVE